MKVQLLTVCLVATLASAGARAESPPATTTEAPAAPAPSTSAAPAAPLPPRLAAQRQELEARRKALEDEQRELAEDIQEIEAEARRIDPEARLTSEQLYELLQLRESRRAGDTEDPGPFIVGVVFLLSALTGFLAWLVSNSRKTRMLHETVRLMVEKGAEIPSGLLAPPPPRKPSDLRRGIILCTAGLGLTIFLAALPHAEGAWGAGLTLFLIGVGHLFIWRLQRGRSALSSELSPEPQP